MLPRRSPGGETGAPTHWQNEKVPGGTSFPAWITGKCFWCKAHHFGVSTPCREHLTDGALQCTWDHGRKPPVWLGWLPLVRESGQPVCAVVQGYSEPEIVKLTLGREVIVKRDKGKGKPIEVLPTASNRIFRDLPKYLASDAAFERWLLRLWSDAKLAEFFGVSGIPDKRGHCPSDNAVSLPHEQPAPLPRTVRADDPRTIGDVLNGVLKKHT